MKLKAAEQSAKSPAQLHLDCGDIRKEIPSSRLGKYRHVLIL